MRVPVAEVMKLVDESIAVAESHDVAVSYLEDIQEEVEQRLIGIANSKADLEVQESIRAL